MRNTFTNVAADDQKEDIDNFDTETSDSEIRERDNEEDSLIDSPINTTPGENASAVGKQVHARPEILATYMSSDLHYMSMITKRPKWHQKDKWDENLKKQEDALITTLGKLVDQSADVKDEHDIFGVYVANSLR